MQSEIPFLQELIQAAHGVGYHVTDHETREALERQTQSAGTQSFLDCLDRALHLPNMTVGGDNNQNNGQHGGAHVAHTGLKTQPLSTRACCHHGYRTRSTLAQYCCLVTVRNGREVIRVYSPYRLLWNRRTDVRSYGILFTATPPSSPLRQHMSGC
jgi:hypothetical protein